MPAFMGATGFYGISSSIDDFWVDNVDATDTHGIWLDQGKLPSSPRPNGKMRWDLQLPERGAPEVLTRPASGSQDLWSNVNTGWESRLAPGAYSPESSIEILRRHAGIWQPVAGTLGRLLAASERITRSPLRQRVWNDKEIRAGNAVLIGDSSRLMLPCSGQGRLMDPSLPFELCQ